MKYECPVGQTLEVYNKDTGHERGQYKRLLDGVKVMNDPSWKGKK
jgi:hypothetical protein